MNDPRQLLENLIALFQNAERIGFENDEPEGSRYIQISDTLANDFLQELIEIEKIWNHHIERMIL